MIISSIISPIILFCANIYLLKISNYNAKTVQLHIQIMQSCATLCSHISYAHYFINFQTKIFTWTHATQIHLNIYKCCWCKELHVRKESHRVKSAQLQPEMMESCMLACSTYFTCTLFRSFKTKILTWKRAMQTHLNIWKFCLRKDLSFKCIN